MRAEPDQAHDQQRGQRQHGPRQHLPALPPATGGEDHEREHDPGGDLDPHPGHDRDGAPAQPFGAPVGPPWTGSRCPRPGLSAGGERERPCERGHHERVVVGPAHGQLEQHRVQPHECHRPLRRASQRVGGVAHERNRPQARDGGQRLQGPQASGQSQRGERVAAEREQGAVGGVLEGPSDEREHGVRGRFGGDVAVGVEPVQRPQPRVAEVPEHVLGEQRRPQQQDHVGDHDRSHQRPQRQRPGAHQHEPVARAHQQRQVLEAVAAEGGGEARERPRQPRGPATDPRGDELRRCAGGPGAQQQHAGEDPEQAQDAQRSRAGGGAFRGRRAGVPPFAAGDARARYRCGRLQGVHSEPTRTPHGPTRPLRFPLRSQAPNWWGPLLGHGSART